MKWLIRGNKKTKKEKKREIKDVQKTRKKKKTRKIYSAKTTVITAAKKEGYLIPKPS